MTLADGEAAIANVIAHPRNATRVLDWSVYDCRRPSRPSAIAAASRAVVRCRFTRVYEAELLYTWRYTWSGQAEAYRKSRTPAKINVYLYPNVCTEELVLDEPAPPTQPPPSSATPPTRACACCPAPPTTTALVARATAPTT